VLRDAYTEPVNGTLKIIDETQMDGSPMAFIVGGKGAMNISSPCEDGEQSDE
jgi:hypothetical protein